MEARFSDSLIMVAIRRTVGKALNSKGFSMNRQVIRMSTENVIEMASANDTMTTICRPSRMPFDVPYMNALITCHVKKGMSSRKPEVIFSRMRGAANTVISTPDGDKLISEIDDLDFQRKR